MVEDSDDDKPVLAAVMRSKAIKQEVDASKAIDATEEKAKKVANGTKAAAVAAMKPTSSSAKSASDRSSSSKADKAPVVSKTSKSMSIVKTEKIEVDSTAAKMAIEASKKLVEKPVDSEDDLPISQLMKKITAIKRPHPQDRIKLEAKKDDEDADEDVPQKKKAARPVADKNSNAPPSLGSEFYQTRKGTVWGNPRLGGAACACVSSIGISILEKND